jgi:hypothetical protein
MDDCEVDGSIGVSFSNRVAEGGRRNRVRCGGHGDLIRALALLCVTGCTMGLENNKNDK